MSTQRIQLELTRAVQHFAFVELHTTREGVAYVKAALQTSANKTYIVSIYFPNYPAVAPDVYVTAPPLFATAPHRYTDGKLCLLYPSMWNPGVHDLTFVLAKTAKWLNKYEVWCETGRWPGASIAH